MTHMLEFESIESFDISGRGSVKRIQVGSEKVCLGGIYKIDGVTYQIVGVPSVRGSLLPKGQIDVCVKEA